MNQNRWVTLKQQGDAFTIHITPLLAEILDCQNKKTTPSMIFFIGSVADMNIGEDEASLQLPPSDEYGVTLHLCHGPERSNKNENLQVILANGPIKPKRIGLDNHNSGESIPWLKGYQKPYPLASVYSRLLSHFFDVICIMLSSFTSVECLTEYLSVWILAHASTNSDPGVDILPRLVVVLDGEVDSAANSENSIRPKSLKEIQHQIESGILDRTGSCLNKTFSELFVENLSSKGGSQRKRQCPTLMNKLLNHCSLSRKFKRKNNTAMDPRNLIYMFEASYDCLIKDGVFNPISASRRHNNIPTESDKRIAAFLSDLKGDLPKMKCRALEYLLSAIKRHAYPAGAHSKVLSNAHWIVTLLHPLNGYCK